MLGTLNSVASQQLLFKDSPLHPFFRDALDLMIRYVRRICFADNIYLKAFIKGSKDACRSIFVPRYIRLVFHTSRFHRG